AHLGSSPQQATRLIQKLLANAIRFGGVLTINWHDRSIAPERLWDEFYSELLQELKKQGAWITTAGKADAWFRKRRAAVPRPAGDECLASTASTFLETDDLPGLETMIHNGSASIRKQSELPASLAVQA